MHYNKYGSHIFYNQIISKLLLAPKLKGVKLSSTAKKSSVESFDWYVRALEAALRRRGYHFRKRGSVSTDAPARHQSGALTRELTWMLKQA